uniref:Uncharacterized protein n=1 Tax=Arundo donax TaxID=35708 RepID=A0A0A8ZRE3_ARUDO
MEHTLISSILKRDGFLKLEMISDLYHAPSFR